MEIKSKVKITYHIEGTQEELEQYVNKNRTWIEQQPNIIAQYIINFVNFNKDTDIEDEILKYMESNYTDEDIEKFLVYYCLGKCDSMTMIDLFGKIAFSVYMAGGEDLIDKYEHKRKYQKKDRISTMLNLFVEAFRD